MNPQISKEVTIEGIPRIRFGDFAIFKLIHKNRHQSVYKVKNRKNMNDVKTVIITDSIQGKINIQKTLSFLRHLTALKHKYLMEIIGFDYEFFSYDNQEIYVVFYIFLEEILMNLAEFCEKYHNQLNEETSFQLLSQIISPYLYLKQIPIFHMDIFPDNFFLTNENPPIIKLNIPRIIQNEELSYREDYSFAPEKYKIGFLLEIKKMDWIKLKINIEKCEIYHLGNVLKFALCRKNLMIENLIQGLTEEDPKKRFSDDDLIKFCRKLKMNFCSEVQEINHDGNF